MTTTPPETLLDPAGTAAAVIAYTGPGPGVADDLSSVRAVTSDDRVRAAIRAYLDATAPATAAERAARDQLVALEAINATTRHLGRVAASENRSLPVTRLTNGDFADTAIANADALTTRLGSTANALGTWTRDPED